MKHYISAADITKKFNISYQTINYYTNLGLLHACKRKWNKRLYREGEVRQRLVKINDLKNQGYPLKIIAQLVNGAANGATARAK